MIATLFGCREQPVSPSEQPTLKVPSISDMSLYSSQKNSIISTEEIDDAIEQTAISLANALKDVEVRRLVKSEAAKEFDGDSEVLFSAISSKRLSDGKSFLQKISHSRAEMKRRSGHQLNDAKAESETAQKIGKVPQFQIGVPYYIIDKWDAETQVPLVVCLPGGVDKGAKKVKRMKAYNSSGDSVWIDMKKFIENPYPVIVLGINERTNPDGSLKKNIIQLEKTPEGLSMKGEQRINIFPDPSPMPSSTWTLVLSSVFIRWSAIDLYYNWDYLSRPDMRCDINPGSPSFRRTDVQWMFTNAETFFRGLPSNNARFISTFPYVGVNIPVFYSTNGKFLVNLDIVDEDWTQLLFFSDPDDLVEHRWRHLGLSNLDFIDFPNGSRGLAAVGDPYYFQGQEYRVDICVYWIPPF